MAGEPSTGSGVPPKSLEGPGVGPQAGHMRRDERESDELIKLREAEFSLSPEMQVLSWLHPRLAEKRVLHE